MPIGCDSAVPVASGRRRRRLHPSRTRAPRAALLEPGRAGVRARRPAGDGQGRAVRALLALPRHAAAAVPGRVRGLAAAQRRGGRRRRRGRAARRSSSSASSSATGTTRWPSSAARTSPASGCSNVLTKILQRPRLAAYLEQSTRYIAYDAPMPGRRLPLLPRRRARARSTRAAMDALFDAYAEALPRVQRVGGRDVPGARAASPRPRAGARSRPRRWTCCAACCPPRRSRTWASTRPARRTSS